MGAKIGSTTIGCSSEMRAPKGHCTAAMGAAESSDLTRVDHPETAGREGGSAQAAAAAPPPAGAGRRAAHVRHVSRRPVDVSLVTVS